MSGKYTRASHLSVLLISGLIGSSGAGTAFSAPNCTCRYKDHKVVQGETACLETSKGMVMARCGMSQNNTSWIFLDTPCPSALNTISPGRLSPRAYPALALNRHMVESDHPAGMCPVSG